MKCICRQCKKVYNNQTSRSIWTGYCSQKCMHEKAKSLGYRKRKGESEYNVLSQVGDMPQ